MNKSQRKAFNATRITDIDVAHADALLALALVAVESAQASAVIFTDSASTMSASEVQQAQSALAIIAERDGFNVDATVALASTDTLLIEHADVPMLTDVVETLTDAAPAPTAPTLPVIDAGKRNNNISAKQWLIDLLSCVDANGVPVSYTLKQLIALTGKTEVNIRTMLSDLRSAKYCGKYGVFNSKSTRINGEWRYAKA